MSGPPPSYTDHAEPLLPNQPSQMPANGNTIPDDFKFADTVAECTVDIRHIFLRRVYTVLVGQIATTVGMSTLIMTSPTVQFWVLNHFWSVWVAMLLSFASLIGVMIFKRQGPWNMTFLVLFTLLESFLVGVSTSTIDTRIVIDALIITMVVFSALTMFALQTRYDFTGWAPYMVAGVFSLLSLGLVSIFTRSNTLELVYSYLAVVLFSGFILVDTQLILTRFHPDDVIPAAIELYLDILNLFLNILRILSDTHDN